MIDLFPNETILCQWLLFALAYLILSRGLFRPILALLEKRKLLTKGRREEVVTLETATDQILSLCEEKLKSAREVGGEEKEKRLMTAEQIHAEQLKKARLEITQKLDRVRLTIEKEARDASLKLRHYTQLLSEEIVGKVLERSP